MLDIQVHLFFFSSRRRHTRLQGDWSSDVCSSDLSHAINVSLYAKLDYDPVKSFTPVAMLGSGPLVLVVPASSPYKTLADVLAASKAKAAAGDRKSVV